jgi:predicted transcriptional regulator
MDATRPPVHDLTAADVMNRHPVVIPRQMLLREAARILHRAKVNGAPVVDEQGRCVGMLFPADILRWVEAGCPESVVGPVHSCPYQVRGRLLTGEEAVICTLADGSCPFQAVQPTIGGRHTEVCMRQGNEDSPFGTLTRYVTTDGVTVRPQTRLPDLMRRMIDSRIDRLVVADEQERPNGTVSAMDILAVIATVGEFSVGASGDQANEQRK